MPTPIPIIDIFAGPGGLGEGFSSFTANNRKVFQIKLSIEKDETAHKTLELRAFYRQFPSGQIPSEYYQYLKKEMDRETLFSKYPQESELAQKEAWHKELKKRNREAVKNRIKEALDGVSTWILIGGPPCQAYSTVGRSRIRGKNKRKYREDRRHFLYKEYLQILADHQPPVFVMENVKGLLSSSRVRGESTFKKIISDLKRPLHINRINSNEPLAYWLFSFSKKRPEDSSELEPKDFVVQSEEYGIPQARHRIFIFGIRSDIYKFTPGTLEEVNKVSIDAVIGDLPKLRSGLSKEVDSEENWCEVIKAIAHAKWLDSLSEELAQAVSYESQKVDTKLTRGAPFFPRTRKPNKYEDWYIDKALDGVCNHESRSHIREDLYRYFFAAVFALVNGRTPRLKDFPKELLPKHKNVEKGIKEAVFPDRFRVQVCGKPSTTIVSHISQDGHYYIHYDPLQCRSLTVREAARLQTFPDNYFFEGRRGQQYHQVGNAVPPMLAQKIAEIVFSVLSNSN